MAWLAQALTVKSTVYSQNPASWNYNFIMKDLIEFIVKSVVKKPKAVKIKQSPGEGFTALEISADKDDLGQIIGKKGRIIKALQALVQVRGVKENCRYFVRVSESERKGVAPTTAF